MKGGLLVGAVVPADISAVGTLAAQVMGQAVISALREATQLAGLLCYSEAQTLAGRRGVF